MTPPVHASPAALTGRLVRIYFDSTRRLWSLVDPQTRKVIGKGREVVLSGCVMTVIESRRLWVVRNKKKVPHAYVEGVVTPAGRYDWSTGRGDAFSYSPYRAPGEFRLVGTGAAIWTAVVCRFVVSDDGRPSCVAYGTIPR